MILLSDLGDAIGLPTGVLRQYIYKGYVKATKIGRQWFVDNEEAARIVKKYEKKRRKAQKAIAVNNQA